MKLAIPTSFSIEIIEKSSAFCPGELKSPAPAIEAEILFDKVEEIAAKSAIGNKRNSNGRKNARRQRNSFDSIGAEVCRRM